MKINKTININLRLSHVMLLSFIINLLFFLNYTSYAAVSIYYRNVGESINSKGGPEFFGEFRATNSSGNKITMNSNNTLLLEQEAIINKTIDFGTSDALGWQKLKWTSALDVSESPSCTFIVSDSEEIGVRRLPDFEFKMPQIGFYRTNDISSEPALELVFDKTQQSQEVKQVYLRYVHPAKMYLDSITFTSPNFSYSWAGNTLDRVPPPKYLMPYNYYLITIEYNRPLDKHFQRECMIFHYGGGLKRKFEILTETYDLPLAKSLELLSPIGGEVLAPCQDFLIKWKGQAVKHPIELSYSTNLGANWTQIDTVPGSENEYLWHVPLELTNKAVVKVAQTFNRADNIELFTPEAVIKSATFNKNATKSITITEDGLLREWDLYNTNAPEIVTELQLGTNYTYIDTKYLNNNTFVVLAQDNTGTSSYLLYFKTGEKKIIKQVRLSDNFISKKILVYENKNLQFLVAVPEKFSNKVQFVDTSGKFICYYISNFPVNDVVINKKQNEIYVSSINNIIKVLSLEKFPIFTENKQYNFSEHWRVIHKLAVSQDARLLSLAMISPIYNNKDSQYNNNYILDNETGTLFRKLIFSQETSLGSDFSPNGNISIFANRGEEWNVDQIAFTDLTGKLDFEKTSFSDFRPGILRGFEVAENGNSLIEYSEGEKNCYVVNFSLPETATNTEHFTIENPELKITNNILDTLLIGTGNFYIFSSSICNIGRVPAVFQTVRFKNNTHLHIKNYKSPDTLQVGECANFEIEALPIDTGMIHDELIFSACGVDYSVPFSFYSKNRNLTTLVEQPMNFGETCVNESIRKKIDLFRNSDTVPILINTLEIAYNKNFHIEYCPKDTILYPNEIYVIEVSFSPLETGILEDKILVYHSGQKTVAPIYILRGTGIGTYLSNSHEYLYFIPEIKTRDIQVKNTGDTELFIDSIIIKPEGTYNILTKLPLVLAASEIGTIKIEFVTNEPQKATLEIIAKPCVISKVLELGAYSGDVLLKVPDIYADPRDTNIKIPILFQMSENVAYQGERDFFAKLSINPRIFYPLGIKSKYGTVSINQNEIINDRRIIGFKLSGDFSETNGTLLELTGAAGLCETDKSELNFISNAKYFGTSVSVNLQNSTFKLINLCDSRRILRHKLEIVSLSPNPASSTINLMYNIQEDLHGKIFVSIFNIYGENIGEYPLGTNISTGSYNFSLPVINLPIGNYTLQINYEEEKYIYNFSIIR